MNHASVCWPQQAILEIAKRGTKEVRFLNVCRQEPGAPGPPGASSFPESFRVGDVALDKCFPSSLLSPLTSHAPPESYGWLREDLPQLPVC